jgi:hypothetical protein
MHLFKAKAEGLGRSLSRRSYASYVFRFTSVRSGELKGRFFRIDAKIPCSADGFFDHLPNIAALHSCWRVSKHGRVGVRLLAGESPRGFDAEIGS